MAFTYFPKKTEQAQFNFGIAKVDGSNAQSPIFFAEEDGYLRVVTNSDPPEVLWLLSETGERIHVGVYAAPPPP